MVQAWCTSEKDDDNCLHTPLAGEGSLPESAAWTIVMPMFKQEEQGKIKIVGIVQRVGFLPIEPEVGSSIPHCASQEKSQPV